MTRKLPCRSPFWWLYAIGAVLTLLAGLGRLSVADKKAVDWILIGAFLAATASFAAQARAALTAGVTITDSGISWVGRRAFVRFEAAWPDIKGFFVTNGPRVLPGVELTDGGQLPLVPHGVGATKARALADELTREWESRPR